MDRVMGCLGVVVFCGLDTSQMPWGFANRRGCKALWNRLVWQSRIIRTPSPRTWSGV